MAGRRPPRSKRSPSRLAARTAYPHTGGQLVELLLRHRLTLKIFGEDGGHAGWNETAMVQAIDPKLVQQRRYSDSLATARAPQGSWTAYPFPSSIILYQPGQGYVKFDQGKADAYRKAVIEKMTALAEETIRKWDQARIFERR